MLLPRQINGETIVAATIAAFRSRNVLLPSPDKLERIGTAGRAVARKRVQTSLLEGLTPERLEAFEQLLIVDPAIRQTRFAWLRALPEAPSFGGGGARLFAVARRREDAEPRIGCPGACVRFIVLRAHSNGE